MLAIEDMEGGTFSISNGGVFGSLFGTPIINQPQSAILGIHTIKKRPVVVNDQVCDLTFKPRFFPPITLILKKFVNTCICCYHFEIPDCDSTYYDSSLDV